ncbi:hypothetical protein UFOVP328_249 [uncultured Caudovirales phage]|uniref:Uncharacterized protein n=1 Tax=uncultured Caudovirales phage TaxID=2100421 RepID=A0A6J5LYR6_9CAUD|nr:hypothetical protein UFOVP328_249 [uncultured Caudovirales phage]
MNKFEQLIEYVINDDESKARELFHDIVVEKSREIYESLMDEEAVNEAEESEEELDEAEESEEELDEGQMGGDASDDLIDDVEMEEEGMSMEAEEIEMDAEEEGEEESGEDLEDRVVDLEDKLDELMAEFEAMMGDDKGFDNDGEEGDAGIHGDLEGDALEMDDTEEFAPEAMGFMENVDLKAAPKPVTAEESGTNTKSTVAANAGAAGAVAKPVSTTGAEAKGRPAPTAKDMGGTTAPKQSAAPKPVTTQAAGVNTKTPFPKG